MKLLMIEGSLHHKNLNAIRKYRVEVTQFSSTDLDNLKLNEYDAVFSPSTPIDVSKYPNTKFVFGPHFSVFPNKNQIELIRSNNSVYLILSDWFKDIWSNILLSSAPKLVSLPFGVDTEIFN